VRYKVPIVITDSLVSDVGLAYNKLGQVASVTQADPDGAGPLPRPVTLYAYSADGRKPADPLGHVTAHSYDDLERLLTTIRTVPGR